MDIRRITENRRAIGTAMLVSVLLLLILVNVIINALATRFSWYLYTKENYEHEIGDASWAVLDDVPEGERVKVIFCTAEEKIEANAVNRLVLNTVRQLAERHDFIDIEFVNIYLHPHKVRPYASYTDASGETVETKITESSVIFASGKDHRVESFSTFFTWDASGTSSGYNGEEIALSLIRWVLADSHPVVGFTNTHGENFEDMIAFVTSLVASGYNITMLDLGEEIPENVAMVVVANPRWDLEASAEGSDVRAELDRLAEFSDRGGTVFVSLDPYAKSDLTGLRAFLSERGLTASQEVIRDTENSLTTDGYTLITDAADGRFASVVFDRINEFYSSHAIVREASAIECTPVGDWQAEPILLSSPNAETYYRGELTDSRGSYPVFAVSRRAAGEQTSTVFLTTSVYLLANDALNSGTYLNRATLMASFEAASGLRMPVGCTILTIGSDRLEGLTIGTARWYAALLTAILPLSVAAVGTVVLVRRKFR